MSAPRPLPDRHGEPARQHAVRPVPQGARTRALGCAIVADQSTIATSLAATVTELQRDHPCRVHVVVPATWRQLAPTMTGEVVRTVARWRLARVLQRLRTLGVEATGEVGDSDPIAAAMAALEDPNVDEVLIATAHVGLSARMTRAFARALGRRAGAPIRDFVVACPSTVAGAAPSLRAAA